VKERERPETPFKMPTKAVGWAIVIGTIVLDCSLTGFLGEDHGTIMAIALGALAMLIQFSWRLRKQWWFWILAGMFAVLNVAGAFRLDWSWIVENRPNGKALGELGFIDFWAMTGITYGMYRLMFGKPSESVEPSIDDLPSYADRDLNL
jgi:hypothetical protein